MLYLETARLILVETPLDVLQLRLQQHTFTADVILPNGAMQVTFPAEWPGDALVLFPMLIEQYQQAPDTVPWGGTLIDRTERVAVGQMGCKGHPRAGAVEIGYGINPAYQQRGYATEMAHALTTWLLNQPDVSRVTAECRTDNYGSIRVLEKAGFARIGERVDDEDGPLFVWERTV
jgi:RimJ/RimL family protein N-acetyltransferase